MLPIQPGILANETTLARYMTFSLLPDTDPRHALRAIAENFNNDELVIGFGSALLASLDAQIPGMRNLPALTGKGIEVPSTPASIWCWLRGDDRGKLLHKGRQLSQLLASAFEPVSIVDAFQYDDNRDLSGYVDGTENPNGDDAIRAAIVTDSGPGLDGSSFVAVQQWLHELDYFDSLETSERDDIIGRHISDNEEFDEAPKSAHVKRAAQESFSPEAFMLRRSMPWSDGATEGLMFVAFGHSLDAFEAILKRMVGLEDGTADALFRFTQPITGGYYWCPPVKDDRFDLAALNIE